MAGELLLMPGLSSVEHAERLASVTSPSICGKNFLSVIFDESWESVTVIVVVVDAVSDEL